MAHAEEQEASVDVQFAADNFVKNVQHVGVAAKFVLFVVKAMGIMFIFSSLLHSAECNWKP